MSTLLARLKHVASPPIGLGCMNLSHGYGARVPEAEALRALDAAFDMGYRHFDTATLYGATANEQLVGRALRGKRDEVFLASKCGMAMDPESGQRVIDGRPATIRQQCEASLSRLNTDHLDLYYLHRLDRQVPIEESVGALARLVDEGKIHALGLSEVSATTLRRARSEYPVAAVQSEYSLWTRNPEIALIEACREADTTLVAFSPLGRGFLAGAVADPATLEEGDIRRGMPRFSAENFPHNLALLEELKALARSLDCNSGQLALAWLLAQGDDIVPIPGSRSIDHMRENLAAQSLRLSPSTLTRLNAMMQPGQVAGARYGAAQQGDIDTEAFTSEGG
ncbi:aldo/keto reductase [Halomonas urumqiensis]|uniref:Aldo/keto reductase n=1 Tax=Halomonas urumqiensis TaxID=1684789 RepID=A0A2N7UNP1_9GAMM|nr:aldo/keto reductase [Halomonas urumqiensis]PMR82057.1 aldo/keto reductase [Halomonas urumqiensis]PTB02611.1 aldo/keto reductase [Halomonas urumqiensis]GHE21094.1 aldo/keto reductase [Halomonas urumqiensis]